jgi:hypothetical protein
MGPQYSSAPDPFKIRRQTSHPLNNEVYDYRGKTLVNPNLTPGESTAVIVSFGDSLNANSGNTNYTPTNAAKVQNLSIGDQGVYLASDPLLGATDNAPAGFYGNWLHRTADQLITAGTYQRIILVPIAVGGAAGEDWADEQIYGYRFRVAKARLAAAGLGGVETFLLGSLGTNDGVRGWDEARITASLYSAIAKLRVQFPTEKVFLSKGSIYNSNPPMAIVRSAITTVVAGSANVHNGGDFDTIPNGDRYDGTHLGAAGLITAAALTTSAVLASLP